MYANIGQRDIQTRHKIEFIIRARLVSYATDCKERTRVLCKRFVALLIEPDYVWKFFFKSNQIHTT